MEHIKVEKSKVSTVQTKKTSELTKKYLPKFHKVDAAAVPDPTKKLTSWSDIQNAVVSNDPVMSASSGLSINANVLSSDNTLEFYYLDAFEKKKTGRVILFGKVFQNGRFVSCCLDIKKIERNLYLLPRLTKLDRNVYLNQMMGKIHPNLCRWQMYTKNLMKSVVTTELRNFGPNQFLVVMLSNCQTFPLNPNT
jgi:hypothetical protein